MPITSSAKKALRASARKRVFNVRRKNDLNGQIKNLKALVSEGKKKEAQAALALVYKALDKAAKTHYIPFNTADRKKSRLATLVASVATK